ncbi:MAG: glycosyltransferase family 39 protein [Terracidiphilus sp.]|nr:glycosyltransferase family 39 protein [Terracidiphilus sp.]
MSSFNLDHSADSSSLRPRSGLPILIAIAGAQVILHLATNSRYGFHRDELQFLWDARHLDWGFVPYPPFTAFVEHVSLSLFGLSLVGLRLFSVLCQAVAIVFTGLTARDLGGNRWAQAAAAFAVALSPLPLFNGTEFQYTSFDFLWWVLIAYFTVRLLTTENPRWWLAIGAVIGLGLETKYAIVFFVAGLIGGMLLTRARRYFVSRWFWAGVGVALLIFLPNLLWLAHHDFISYTFLQHIHARDVAIGRANGFFVDQLRICINTAAVPVALIGLIAFLRSRRYRMLAWMWIIPVALLFVAKGRGYYTSGVYPMVLAMGAATCQRWLASLPALARRSIASVYFAGVAAVGAYVIAFVIPLAPSGPLRDFALSHNGDLREEFGWNELVSTVGAIRDSLPPEQQSHLGISVQNYGEAGAIDSLGQAYHLPPPISTVNSGWLRGYPTPPPTTFIVLGLGREEADSIFTGCRWAGHNGNAEGIRNEESVDHPDIFVCGPPRLSWPEFWKRHHDFG